MCRGGPDRSVGEDSVVSPRDASVLRQSRETFQGLADPTKKHMLGPGPPSAVQGVPGQKRPHLGLGVPHCSTVSLILPGRSCDSSPFPLPHGPLSLPRLLA